jgi:hypothetical protein
VNQIIQEIIFVNILLHIRNKKIAAFGSSYGECVRSVGAAEGCDLLIFLFLLAHTLCGTREQRPRLLRELAPFSAGDKPLTLHVISGPQQPVVLVLCVDAVFGQGEKLSPNGQGLSSLRFFHRAPPRFV